MKYRLLYSFLLFSSLFATQTFKISKIEHGYKISIDGKEYLCKTEPPHTKESKIIISQHDGKTCKNVQMANMNAGPVGLYWFCEQKWKNYQR